MQTFISVGRHPALAGKIAKHRNTNPDLKATIGKAAAIVSAHSEGLGRLAGRAGDISVGDIAQITRTSG